MEWSDQGVHAAWKQINQLYKIPEILFDWNGGPNLLMIGF